MERSLEGKVAIVTGGTRGIGRSIAEALLDAGISVTLSGRTEATVEAAARELSAEHPGKVAGVVADVKSSAAVAELFTENDRRFGRLDYLINNAGVGVFKKAADLSVDEWRDVVETNLHGVFYATREAVPRFRTAGGGYIVNISSLAGKNPFAGGAAYNASKFGLNGFSEATMLDHRADNVRVSYVMPGSVDTEFGHNSTGAAWKIAPEDIADIVMMLLRMPERTLVSRVEVRPSRPPSK